jgi:hypothetical protein
LHYTYYSRSPLIRIKWDGKPSGYAENPDNWIFFENRLHWQFEVGKKILQTSVFGYIFIYVQMKHYYVISYMYLTAGENFKP